jgi:hypothetical protein
VLELEDRLRAGTLKPEDFGMMVEQGALMPDEAREIVKAVKRTQGLDPEQARLVTRASRLGLPDFLQIWELAVPSEKVALQRLLLDKRNKYMKKLHKTVPPDQWNNDPTYQWIKKMFPAFMPWGEDLNEGGE